jgi:glutamyl-tRNA synthetase
MRAASCESLVDALDKALPYLGQSAIKSFDAPMRATLLAAMPGLKERAKTLVELLDGAQFLFAPRPLPMDAKATAILATGRPHLVALLPRFEALTTWTAAMIEAEVRAYVGETKVKLGEVAQPLRAALTGRSVSPGVFDVFEVLGRDESLGRLRDQAA